jgi:MFS family permease
MVIAGIALAFSNIPGTALLIAYSKKCDREKNFGLSEMTAGLGLLLGPLLGSLLFEIGGFSVPFLILGKFPYVLMFL